MESTSTSLMLPAAVANNLPAMVRNELSQMSATSQDAFLEEYQRQAKGTGIAYIFFLFFGCHYAYLGNWGKQILFWITFGGAGIWALIDLFRLPSVVAGYNKDVATNVMRNLKAIGGNR